MYLYFVHSIIQEKLQTILNKITVTSAGGHEQTRCFALKPKTSSNFLKNSSF